MKIMQSFLIFFYILDQGYSECQEDDLGGFLGVISPELWADGKPMDKSIFNFRSSNGFCYQQTKR